jgi:hypothetical protein
MTTMTITMTAAAAAEKAGPDQEVSPIHPWI